VAPSAQENSKATPKIDRARVITRSSFCVVETRYVYLAPERRTTARNPKARFLAGKGGTGHLP
jgi:hypothetical protein